MAEARIVCHVMAGTGAFAGGMGRAAAGLSAEMARLCPGLEFRTLDTRGSGHVALAPLFLADALGRIATLAARGRLALLHVHLSAHGSAARKLAVVTLGARLGVPVLLQLHGSRFDAFWRGLPGPGRRLVRAIFDQAGHVVVLGEYWRRLVVEEVGIPAAKVEAIRNGVPARPRARGPDGAPHLVFLGQLGPRKGVPELLAALASPALAARPWRATLAGGGDLDALRAELRRLGLADRVALPGWLDPPGVDRLLDGATALLLPSHAENLPMAVIEALAAGLPVVTTPVGAIPELLEDGRSALLVPPGDAPALASAVARLLDDAALRAQLAEGGAAAFARHFDIATVARRMAAAYSRLGVGADVPAIHAEERRACG